MASTISNLGDGISLIAYPWLASAVTRNPLLIALIVAAQRIPWLVFTLPAGVITDRYDRRLLMAGANAVRFVLTAVVAFAVFVRRDVLPAPDAVDEMVGTESLLYVTLLVATFLLGVCEVLYDNSAQTIMPALVADVHLERANGRLYSSELVANQFVGPPLAGVLLAVGFALPFVVDAGTFAVSAVLVASITVRRRPQPAGTAPRPPWRTEIAEGFGWLWQPLGDPHLGAGSWRPQLAWQRRHRAVRDLCPGGARHVDHGVRHSWDDVGRRWVDRRLGGLGRHSTPWRRYGCLSVSVVVIGLMTIVVGLVSSWLLAAALLSVGTFFIVVWNVITVSFRQSVIPEHLLGRVNSVYRFFGWGAIPIGALIGGGMVAVLDGPLDRDAALRVPWIVAGVLQVGMIVMVRPLTTERLGTLRAAGRNES